MIYGEQPRLLLVAGPNRHGASVTPEHESACASRFPHLNPPPEGEEANESLRDFYGNGAGKTTVTERGLAHEWFAGCEYVNPDFIARDEFGDWNSEPAVLRAATLASERRERCVAEHRSLAFESVFSVPDKVDFLRRAQAAGFFTRVFFVATTDPSINAARVARRVMQGGHDVPIQKIIARHFRSIANCALVAHEVDRLYGGQRQ